MRTRHSSISNNCTHSGTAATVSATPISAAPVGEKAQSKAAIIYYDWTEVPGKPDSWAIFRCGAITDAGKLALSPM
jgi:hypothetical protein